MYCIKLLGQRLTARDFKRQITEIYIRTATLNRFTALGSPMTQAVVSPKAPSTATSRHVTSTE